MGKIAIIVDKTSVTLSCVDRINILSENSSNNLSLVYMYNPGGQMKKNRMLMLVDKVLENKALDGAKKLGEELGISDVHVVYPEELKEFLVNEKINLVVDCKRTPLSESYTSDKFSVVRMN